MAETTISWTSGPNGEQGFTFNPWLGCSKVSPACDSCYAEALMGTTGRHKRAEWGGPGVGVGTRVRTSADNWRKPISWDKKAKADGTRPFVFCASLADVFDNAVPAEWRRDLFDLIRATPNLTWLLLTKRPGNIVKLYQEQQWMRVPADQDTIPIPDLTWPRNAAIGCTVVNQEEADRDVPKLLAAKAALNPAFAFLSMEPLLGPVDLQHIEVRAHGSMPTELSNKVGDYVLPLVGGMRDSPTIDWVITGGETHQGKHRARPSYPGWFRSLRDQCEAAGVAYHHKQNGEFLDEQQMAAAGIDPRDLPKHKVIVVDGVLYGDVGKKRAGRLLGGVEHNGRPE